MKLIKEEIKQAFFSLADEMEQECSDWQNLPDNPDLIASIMATAMMQEKKRKQP